MKENIDFNHNGVRDVARFELLRDLEYVLRVATGNDKITLIFQGENVIINRNNGVAQIANVKGDSALEMANDIINTAMHGQLLPYVHPKEGDSYAD